LDFKGYALGIEREIFDQENNYYSQIDDVVMPEEFRNRHSVMDEMVETNDATDNPCVNDDLPSPVLSASDADKAFPAAPMDDVPPSFDTLANPFTEDNDEFNPLNDNDENENVKNPLSGLLGTQVNSLRDVEFDMIQKLNLESDNFRDRNLDRLENKLALIGEGGEDLSNGLADRPRVVEGG